MQIVPVTFLTIHELNYDAFSTRKRTFDRRPVPITNVTDTLDPKSMIFLQGDDRCLATRMTTKFSWQNKALLKDFFEEILTKGFVWIKFINPEYEYYDSIVKLTFDNQFFPLKKFTDQDLMNHSNQLLQNDNDIRNPFLLDANHYGSLVSTFISGRLGTDTNAIFVASSKLLMKIKLSIDESMLDFHLREAPNHEKYHGGGAYKKCEDMYRRRAFRNNTDGFVWLQDYTGPEVLKHVPSRSDKIYPSYKGVVKPQDIVDTLGEELRAGDSIFYCGDGRMLLSVITDIEQTYITIRYTDQGLQKTKKISHLSDTLLKLSDDMFDNAVKKKLIS